MLNCRDAEGHNAMIFNGNGLIRLAIISSRTIKQTGFMMIINITILAHTKNLIIIMYPTKQIMGYAHLIWCQRDR